MSPLEATGRLCLVIADGARHAKTAEDYAELVVRPLLVEIVKILGKRRTVVALKELAELPLDA